MFACDNIGLERAGEMAEWLNSDAFSKTLNVSLNRVKDGTWMCRLGAAHGCILEMTV
jgi:hypothetical protein